ncbi:AAA family ATPase, partial [bacterium]|nr:AAA family ATPase [bacterium]
KRKYFSIDRPLVKHEIIELSLYNNINILQADVELHSRFCRFIMDDQNTYDTDFHCISSEVGSVNIDQIIIDEKTKRDVVSYTKSFISNTKNRDQLSLLYGYGVGLTFLFHGPSGTGKTMMAHALSNHFGKKLYSINVQGLEYESISFEDALKFAFREARINNGIVFLDECDDLFQEKSYESRTFLLEVEKACCMTILASNTALKLDPAMDRRINMKTFFPMPNKKMRARIWQALTPSTLNLDEDDFQELAEKYIFTGGLVKNALVMASTNLNSDHETNAIIEKSAVIAEIHTAAQYQAESIFDHNGYGTVITPRMKLDELIINPNDKEKLLSLIRHYPAILDNVHGFCGLISATDRQAGHDCLEALAYGCGAKIRKFSMASIFNQGESRKHNHFVDPFSQREMTIIDYIFKCRPGQPEIICLIDDIDIFALNSSLNMQELTTRIRDFTGSLFVLSNKIKNKKIPLEFTFTLELEFPPISIQAGHWKNNFTYLDEGEIYQIIKRYPMHPNEIEFVARNITVKAMINEDRHQNDLDNILEAAATLRGCNNFELFGNKRTF